MKPLSPWPVVAVIAFALSLDPMASAAPRTPVSPPPGRPLVFYDQRRIDVNNVSMFVSNVGSYAMDISTGFAGLNYPNHTSKTAMFAAGLWLGATVDAGFGPETLVTLAEYTQEYLPGRIVGGVPEYPGDARLVVYKVAPWTGLPADTDHVENPAADPTLGEDPLVHHSWSEYVNGAKPFGAPTRLYRFDDTSTPAPGDSVTIEGPDVQGDQMLWCVYNDADPVPHTNHAGNTAPLGVQVAQTTFAFNRPGSLGNVIFIEYKIENGGSNFLRNMYVSLWADPDIGDFADDLAGCDIARNLGYGYNGTNSDAIYGSAPPAVGLDLLRGPVGVVGDTMEMTAFSKYSNGTDPQMSRETYSFMSGRNADGSPVIDPTTGFPTRYMMSGDPVSGFGWLDSAPGDRRVLVTSGPIAIAPGETQEIIAAVIVGQGSSRLSSISAMRINADAAREFVRGPIPTPVLLSIVSADAGAGAVSLRWHAAGGAAASATVYRREEATGWEALAEIAASGTGDLSYQDRAAVPGHRYGYRLGVRDANGAETLGGETWVDVPALGFAVEGFRPNPAARQAMVSFTLPDASPARLEVLDVGGRRIVARDVGSLGPGTHTLPIGPEASLAPGLYFIRLTRGGRAVIARGAVVE